MRTMLRMSRPYSSSRCASVMTSYGGAITPPSFTCSALYRVAPKGWTFAIRASARADPASEPNLAELVEHRGVPHLVEQLRAHGVVDLHEHHRVAARAVATELDARDVDVVAREQRRDRGDHAWAILVRDHQVDTDR